MIRIASAPGRTGSHRLMIAASMLAGALFASSAPAQQGDPLRGRLLYENHCQDCHTSSAHVRATRRGDSAASVRAYVSRWQGVQGLGWSHVEIEDVTTWLYLRFYDPARPTAPESAERSG